VRNWTQTLKVTYFNRNHDEIAKISIDPVLAANHSPAALFDDYLQQLEKSRQLADKQVNVKKNHAIQYASPNDGRINNHATALEEQRTINRKMDAVTTPDLEGLAANLKQTYSNMAVNTSWLKFLGITDYTTPASWDSIGTKRYELDNHLGNVMTTVTDKRLQVASGGGIYFTADIASTQDYYPFGMLMPGRLYMFGGDSTYRYGFNGKENDNTVKGLGNWQDYGERIYDPRLGRFLSVDPISKNYPWLGPYSFAENSPLRFIDIDGNETANPSIFRRVWNSLMGDDKINRMDKFITDFEIDPETVISLPNDTYVIEQTFFSARTNSEERLYSVFRKDRNVPKLSGYTGDPNNDDYFLTEEQFLHTKILGNYIIPAPMGPEAAEESIGVAIKGSKSLVASFREVVGIVKVAAKEITAWKNEIRFGVADATGISGDVLQKGFHLHVKNFEGLELTLKPLKDGEIGVGIVAGKAKYVKQALNTLNRALKNPNFRAALLVNLKATQETLQTAAKVLANANYAQMAIDRAHEINYLIQALIKMQ